MRYNQRTLSAGFPSYLSSRAAGSADQESCPGFLRPFVRPASEVFSDIGKDAGDVTGTPQRDDTGTVPRISQRRSMLVARSWYLLNVLLTVRMCACGAPARFYLLNYHTSHEFIQRHFEFLRICFFVFFFFPTSNWIVPVWSDRFCLQLLAPRFQ